MAEPVTLIHAYLDGLLSDGEQRELEEWLAADPANAKTFAEFAVLHDQLHNEFASRSLLAEGEAEAATEPQSLPAPARNGRPLRAQQSALIACAVALLLAVLFFVRQEDDEGPPKPASEIVTVARVAGTASWSSADGNETPLAAEASLRSGSTITTSGPSSFVVLNFADNTRLFIAGDSAVRCVSVSPKSFEITRGAVSATVTPQPTRKPMTLATPLASVEVLGTEFSLAATTHVTDLKVTEGRVKMTRADGESLVVDEGKRALAKSESPKVVLEDASPQSGNWYENFEEGLPANCNAGEHVTKALPDGSLGGVADIHVGEGTNEVYAIDFNDWINGLFRVYDDSHLHIVYRMEHPGWMNIFFLTRADDPETSDVTLHMLSTVQAPVNTRWHKAVIPLSKFMRKVDGKFTDLPPKNDQLCFGLAWSWVNGKRDMVIDAAWISRGGPGTIEVTPLDEVPESARSPATAINKERHRSAPDSK